VKTYTFLYFKDSIRLPLAGATFHAAPCLGRCVNVPSIVPMNLPAELLIHLARSPEIKVSR
jgi:hypothetical protein